MSRCAYRRPLSVALRRTLSLACLAVGIFAAAPAAVANAPGTAPDYQSIIRTSQAAIGRPLADIRLRDSNGKAVRFSDYQGRPLLISLVYTGCFQACPVA
ncbi:MAG: hypothetical protein KJ011_21030, partial [Burkholderiaceae bacterium]|nr:hypothetical protein [Burkholderiaceae bacterium]